MRQEIRCGALIALFFLGCSTVYAQTQRQPHASHETWYEFLLKQFNPRNVDYGGRFERRRQAFLQATVREPYFWYGASVTAGMLVILLAYAKLHLDHRRTMRITSEMMADIYTHDLYSRQTATEAIRKYNEHIEQCNRGIEADESVDGRPGWGDAATESLRAELQRVGAQLEATTQERNKLRDELRQKAMILADLSTRLDNLTKKMNGARDAGHVSTEPSADGNPEGARLVGQINRLQEELYAERQKNKRLKGA